MISQICLVVRLCDSIINDQYVSQYHGLDLEEFGSLEFRNSSTPPPQKTLYLELMDE